MAGVLPLARRRHISPPPPRRQRALPTPGAPDAAVLLAVLAAGAAEAQERQLNVGHPVQLDDAFPGRSPFYATVGVSVDFEGLAIGATR